MVDITSIDPVKSNSLVDSNKENETSVTKQADNFFLSVWRYGTFCYNDEFG